MFLRHCIAVFLLRTRPASSMAKPAAIHMTRKPCIRNDRVLKMKTDSSGTCAMAGAAVAIVVATTRAPAKASLGAAPFRMDVVMRISLSLPQSASVPVSPVRMRIT